MEAKKGVVKEEGWWKVIWRPKREPKEKIKMWVLAKTKGMRVSTASMIKNLEIREEEVEDVDKVQEEKAFMVLIFILMKKIIMPTNSLNAKEGQIGELMVKQGFLMWMRMHNHHIQRMWKEESF